MENGLNIHSEGSIIVPRLHDLEIIENIQLWKIASSTMRIRVGKINSYFITNSDSLESTINFYQSLQNCNPRSSFKFKSELLK